MGKQLSKQLTINTKTLAQHTRNSGTQAHPSAAGSILGYLVVVNCYVILKRILLLFF